jgi:hypothetical protein
MYSDTKAIIEMESKERAHQVHVSLMITRAQKIRLREMGYDDVAIRNMTPAQAHKALGLCG